MLVLGPSTQPMLRMGLPSSVKPLWKFPHRHHQSSWQWRLIITSTLLVNLTVKQITFKPLHFISDSHRLIRQNKFSLTSKVTRVFNCPNIVQKAKGSEMQGKVLTVSFYNFRKQVTYFQCTKTQSKHFHSNSEEWGMAREDWIKATPKPSRENTIPWSASGACGTICHLGSNDHGQPHPSNFVICSLYSLSHGMLLLQFSLVGVPQFWNPQQPGSLLCNLTL